MNPSTTVKNTGVLYGQRRVPGDVDSPYQASGNQAAIGGCTISSLGLSVDAPSRVILFASPREFSKAAQVWTQADKGARTDEAHAGHRGLHGDALIANTSSQSIQRKTSFSFMIASTASTLVAVWLFMGKSSTRPASNIYRTEPSSLNIIGNSPARKGGGWPARMVAKVPLQSADRVHASRRGEMVRLKMSGRPPVCRRCGESTCLAWQIPRSACFVLYDPR